jgi:hypothetical protein
MEQESKDIADCGLRNANLKTAKSKGLRGKSKGLTRKAESRKLKS